MDRIGRLEVICGPMFSGKTTELIRRLSDSSGSIAITPARDTRFGGGGLGTHDGRAYPAMVARDASGVVAAASGAGVVGIDEAHFFGKPLSEVCRELVGRGTRVIVAGVEVDHAGEPFEPFPSLLCLAEDVMKRTCPCACCGRPAFVSHRRAASAERIVVGGSELYEARCRECFTRRA